MWGTMVRFLGRLIVVLLSLAPSAALAQDKNDYTPSPQALAAISIEQARAIIAQELPKWEIVTPHGDTPDITRVKVGLTQIELTDEDRHIHTVSLAGAQIVVVFRTFFTAPMIYVGDVNLRDPSGMADETIPKIVDAFYVLRNAAQREVSPAGDAAFAQVVSDYRQAQPKPHIPEDVRRYEVQAKVAIQEGNFANAADSYAQGLQIAPWWPDGHFDRAAVLAEIGEYQAAIAEMQRYLLLAPDATDARASQDKIYEWESRFANATQAGPPPTSRPSKPF